MSNNLKIPTRHGMVHFNLYRNPFCCGVIEYGHPTWPLGVRRAAKTSAIRMETYEDVLMSLRHCFAQGGALATGWGVENRYSRGIGTLSDALNGEGGAGVESDPPCIYDMMTLVAPKLSRQGKLLFNSSGKAYNPNSGRMIMTWQLRRDVDKYDKVGMKVS